MISQNVRGVESHIHPIRTGTSSERLDQLLERCDTLVLDEPSAALPLATEALRIARSLADDSRILRALFGVANCHRRLGDYDRGLRWLKKGVALLDRLPDDPHRRGRLNGAIGLTCYMTDDNEGTLHYLTLALEYGRRAADVPGMLGAIVVLGELALVRGDYVRTFELLLEGIALAEELGNPRATAPLLKNLGRAYHCIDDLPAALDAHTRALELFRSIGDRFGEAGALSYLGGVVRMMGNWERGLEYYTEALVVFEELNNIVNQCRSLRSIGRIRLQLGDTDAALASIRRALDLATDAGSAIERGFALHSMGDLFIAIGDHGAALPLLDEALVIVREQHVPLIESEICESLAVVHEKLGDLSLSIAMFRRHAAIMKDLNGPEIAREVERMRARHSLERAEREKSRLARKIRQLERDLERMSSELRTTSRRLERERASAARLRMDLIPFTHVRDQDAATLARFLMERIDGQSVGEAEWGVFDGQFQRMHPSYLPALLGRHGTLSRMELKICMLLRLNLSSKEIARVINLSVHTVDTHRRRIRRKLALNEDMGLTSYLSSIE